MLPPSLLLKHVIIQKFLRINYHVQWPVHWTSQIIAHENIERGNRTPGLSIGCYLDGRNGIIIGKNTWIGPKVSIISMNHDKINYHNYRNASPIVIGANCWIATGAIILPEVEIGDHVVVAAGSVVTKSFTQNDLLIGGNPAVTLKRLSAYDEV